jgi:uncharacterized membrane protein YvlD (DUF360 family)
MVDSIGSTNKASIELCIFLESQRITFSRINIGESLGLFLLVINGFTFWLASRMLPGFQVDSFWAALLAALVYSLITTLISAVLRRTERA